MPVFARTKMVLQDNCWDVTEPVMRFRYSGLDPQLAYSKIRELFWTVFQVKEGERVQERDFTWDRKGKRETFKVSWDLAKDMDKFTYLYFRINMKGFAEEVENERKEGQLVVEMDGVTRTEYPQDTIWERNIFYEMTRVFWHRVFYATKRQEYQDVCRDMMARFMNELKAFLNLLPKR